MGTTKVEIPLLRVALGHLQQEAPQENELNNLFTQTATEISPISTKHDSFLKDSIAQIESGGDLFDGFKQINEDYNKYVLNISKAIAKLEAAERSGRPENDGSGTPDGEDPPSPSSTLPPVDPATVTTPDATDPTNPTGTPVGNNPTDPTGTPDGTNPTNPTGDPVGNNPTGNPAGTAAATAGTAAATAIAGNEIGGQGSPDDLTVDPVHDHNPFGSSEISAEAIEGLTPEEREALKRKLKDLGFSDSEIEEIFGGQGSVPSVQVDATASALEEALRKDPNLRSKLMAQYGFDIFNPDGTVNRDRLALALMMDNKNGTDNYSLYEYLRTQYGINIVNPTDLTNLASRLEVLLSKYPDLRTKLFEKYGFDLFNPDGTINKDKLALAMLMDAKNGSDDFDLLAYLANTYGDEGLASLLGDVKKPAKVTPVKKSGVGAVPVAAGLGVLGAIGGGTALLIKKKKDEEEDEEEKEMEDELKEDPTAVIEETKKMENLPDTPRPTGKEKEWLHGIGLGAQQTPDGKVIGTFADETISNDDREEDSEYIRLNKVKPGKAQAEGKINFMPFLAAGAAAGVAGKVFKDHRDDKDDDSSEEKKEGNR